MATLDDLLNEIAVRLRLVIEKERESLQIDSIEHLEAALARIEDLRRAPRDGPSSGRKREAVRLALDLLRAFDVVSDLVM